MILPNSTVGVFGSGQLGRMFAIEARKMGYRVHTFSPDSDTPAGQVADLETSASFDDLDAVRAFARGVDVVTFEFENVPSQTIETAEEFVKVYPGSDALHIIQNRFREKDFLRKKGFPVVDFRHILTLDDLQKAVVDLGTPCILKTAGFGYDGKGQVRINTLGDIPDAFEFLKGSESILEAFVDFEKEVSVVCARDKGGNFVHYGVIENDHRRHILDVSFAPAAVTEKVLRNALELAREIAESLSFVGTLCIEYFVTRFGGLLVNELAPRPHNSGHLTFDACVTSQFEQQLRAVCSLPLGSTDYYSPAAMINLMGELWLEGEPDWPAALQNPRTRLHLYGKSEARTGRKMGHLTALAPTAKEAVDIVRNARNNLEKH